MFVKSFSKNYREREKCTVIANTNKVLAEKTIFAKTFLERLKGLMFITNMEDNTALVLEPCNSIHTFFMRFPIDVIFTSKEGRVLHVIEGMKPFKISKIVKGARYAIEMPSGAAKGVKSGQCIKFI
jgi:hypothetical protein